VSARIRSRTGEGRRLAVALALLGLTLGAGAALAQGFRAERAELDLAADRTAYEPGATARIAALVAIEPGWHVNAHRPSFDYLIPTELTLGVPPGWPAPEVAYPEPVMRTFAFDEHPLAVYEGRVTILATLRVPESAAAGRYVLHGQLRYQACDDSSCLPPVTTELPLDIAVGPGGGAAAAAVFGGAAGATTSPAAPPAAATSAGATTTAPRGGPAGDAAPNLPWILTLALLGGLILNAMPCVLPVLSLKVFGLVQSAGLGRREVVVGALATAAGILASFTGLAVAAAGAKAAGSAVGWGVQFQRPGFVAFLAVVVVLFSLNLWGLFEIHLPWRLANALGAGRREGVAGHFVSGLFATLMATPCSAPFLGTAMGFALAQEAGVILAVFAAVGVGMALPYLVLAVAPRAAALLPRPGAWMETLKLVMGFLLAGAGVWLLYVLSAQVSPERLAAIELALLALALFVWLRSRAAPGPALRRAAAAGIAAAVAGTLALAATAGGVAQAAPRANGGSPVGGGRIAWQPFDRDRAEALAASGTLVFVDVTADWCFTCKANERLVLETAETVRLFADHGVVAMKADWTNRDDSIAAFLADHGRYSIPFYLLYRPGAQPHLFSELLTKAQVAEAVRASDGQLARR
jgi:suppressor for copper-sensitivity B